MKNIIHEKISESIKVMLCDMTVNLPYYGNFNLFINFKENENISTCGVNVTMSGMNFYYSSEFLSKLTQKQINFIVLHEDFHLLFNHPKRTVTGHFNHKISNIAQDMIINHIIWEDFPDFFVEIPKDEKGRNMALFLPKEYTGKLIFEELYTWLKEKKEERENSNNHPLNEEQEYGPNAQNPRDSNSIIDSYSLEHILDNIDNNDGEYLDHHMGDDVPESYREAIVNEAMERLQARGLVGDNVKKTLNKLVKKRKDHLKYIKRSISNEIFGTKKQKSITKPNRRQIEGLKGNKKTKTKINVILDTSGSMGGQGTFEKILSYVYRNDIELNFIQGDTEVKWVENFKSKNKLTSMKIVGLGGTILQPSVNYVVDHFNKYNTVILSDGFTDQLDLSKVRGNVLMISVGVKMPIKRSNNKVRQIVLEKD